MLYITPFSPNCGGEGRGEGVDPDEGHRKFHQPLAFNQKGFTLIEMIMVMVILGIIGTITFQVLSAGVETFVVSRERKDLYDQGRLALERMAREIRAASGIAYPVVGASGTYINFTMAAAQPGALDTSTSFTYQVNGGNLERVGDVSGTHTLASDVSTFTVTHEAGNYLSLELSLSSTKGGTVSMRTGVHARNGP
jgi:prepilin-type N-terminal cleavage/methylation domain-containing protein